MEDQAFVNTVDTNPENTGAWWDQLQCGYACDKAGQWETGEFLLCMLWMSCIRGDKCFPCYSHGSSCVSSFLVMMASHSILTFVNIWNRELWVPPCAVLAWASPCRESQSQFVVAKIPVHKVIQRPSKLAITGLKAEVHLWRDISLLYHAYYYTTHTYEIHSWTVSFSAQ